MKAWLTPKPKLTDHRCRKWSALLLPLLAALATTNLGAQPFTLMKKLVAHDGGATDYFGVSVAADGDLIVVGAGYQSTPTMHFKGAAYLFERNANGLGHWGLRKKLHDAVTGDAEEMFGYTVSLSGDVIVAGVPGKTFSLLNGVGATVVSERNRGGVNNWEIYGPLWGNFGAGAFWGISVAVSGDTFVSGARQADVGANVDQGAAEVWTNSPSGGWTRAKALIASDGAANDRFGWKVAISGDVIIVGAPYADVAGKADQGAAYVFARNAGGANQWGFVKKLTASDGAPGDNFSHFSIGLDGATLAVGAPWHDEGANTDQGAVYIFERDAGGANNWGQTKKLTASDGTTDDYFGFVSLGGDTLVAGAPWGHLRASPRQGVAYVFERHAGGANNWGQTQQLLAPDGVPGDNFGGASAVSGEMIVVGAQSLTVGTNAYQGAAYLFTRPAWEAGLGLTELANGYKVSVAGVPGTNYVLQRAPDMLGLWQSLTNWTCPLEGVIERLDTNPPQPAGFYRAYRN